MTHLNVNIRKLSPDAITPTYATDGAATFDLYANAGGVIAPGQTAVIPLGIAFEIPTGYAMIVAMCEDTAFTTSLRPPNGVSVVGPDDSGEVAMLLENVNAAEYGDDDSPVCGREILTLDGEVETWDIGLEYETGSYLIRKGDLVAQGFLLPLPRVEFTEVAAA